MTYDMCHMIRDPWYPLFTHKRQVLRERAVVALSRSASAAAAQVSSPPLPRVALLSSHPTPPTPSLLQVLQGMGGGGMGGALDAQSAVNLPHHLLLLCFLCDYFSSPPDPSIQSSLVFLPLHPVPPPKGERYQDRFSCNLSVADAVIIINFGRCKCRRGRCLSSFNETPGS